jgi:hypothetical protein
MQGERTVRRAAPGQDDLTGAGFAPRNRMFIRTTQRCNDHPAAFVESRRGDRFDRWFC